MYSQTRVIETDGYLSPLSGFPEGKLLIAILERAFCDLGEAFRAIERVNELLDKPAVTMAEKVSRCFALRRRVAHYAMIEALDEFIAFDAVCYGSLRYIAQHVAQNDDSFVEAVRIAWRETKARGDYKTIKKRALHNYGGA